MKTLLVSEIGDLILFNLDGTATETHNLTSRRVSCCEASPSSRNIVAVGSFVCKWFTLLTINITLYIVILLRIGQPIGYALSFVLHTHLMR